MAFKIVIIIFLLVILYCLGSGLYYLARDGFGSIRLAKALTWRIILSLLLFGLLLIAYIIGWISPHMIMVAPPQ